MKIVEYNPISTVLPLHFPGVLDVTALETEARFNLRARSNALEDISKALGFALPTRMGDVADSRDRCVICVAPDEWLLSAPLGQRSEIKAVFDKATLPLSLVEITDRECGFRISGSKAAYTLKAACPHNVSEMTVNTATRTLFEQADVTVLRESETSYRLQMLRSWSVHVASLLAVIGREVATGL